jgi:preprotein translocase subunit Sss1
MDRTEFSADGNLLGSMSTYRRLLHLWRAPSWEEIEQAEKAQAASARPQ